jgi:hypothetical protein
MAARPTNPSAQAAALPPPAQARSETAVLHHRSSVHMPHVPGCPMRYPTALPLPLRAWPSPEAYVGLYRYTSWAPLCRPPCRSAQPRADPKRQPLAEAPPELPQLRCVHPHDPFRHRRRVASSRRVQRDSSGRGVHRVMDASQVGMCDSNRMGTQGDRMIANQSTLAIEATHRGRLRCRQAANNAIVDQPLHLIYTHVGARRW